MLKYGQHLKSNARLLRNSLTDSERILWSRLRRKRLFNVPFYRQKPIGNYIVDFYAPKARLVVEVDGSQHLTNENIQKDKERDVYLGRLELQVLRFDSRQVLKELDTVVEVIARMINPTSPPFFKGGE